MTACIEADPPCNDTFGVLKLTLHSNGWDWAFVPQAGKTYNDSGTGTCH